MGIFEDLNCDKMTILQFRKQVEKWAASGDISVDDIDYIVNVEATWREIVVGNCNTMTGAEFINELEKW